MNEINLLLSRIQSSDKETLSNIAIIESNKLLFACVGMELPWKNNEHQISCIPVGQYDCEKVGATASIPYQHISITNVPDRSGVCIHKANFVSSLRGCIAIGDKFVDINGDGLLDITNSSKTYIVLMTLLPDKFKLIIS